MNVLLGLGLPWLLGSVWETMTDGNGTKKYNSGGAIFVPGGSLGFSVIVFVTCAIIGLLILIIRRKIVGGELGGGQSGRTISAVSLCSLWLLYVIMCILQTYKIGGLADSRYGIQDTKNPNPLCN